MIDPSSSQPHNPSSSTAKIQFPNTGTVPNSLSKAFLHRTIHDAGHDLKSPLFVIRGYSQLLQRVEDKDALNRGIKLMEQASYKLEHTINGLVELMDIYTASDLKEENLQLNQIIDEATIDLHDKYEAVDFTIHHTISEEEHLLFEESFLKTILSCLLDNAIRHNQDREILQLSIEFNRMEDGKAVLVVEDNGKGIDKESDLNIIKKPFYKFGENTETVGVGLAKVEAIAQVTNNSFSIESEVWNGTKCSFYFMHQVGAKEIKQEQPKGARGEA